MATSKDHQEVIATSVVTTVEKRDPNDAVTWSSSRNDPGLSDHLKAVIAAYPKGEIDFGALEGQPATVLRSGDGMMGNTVITAYSGKIFRGQRGWAIMPPRARRNGFSVEHDSLDIRPGYYQADQFRAVIDSLPISRLEWDGLTQEHLDSLPNEETAVRDQTSMVLISRFGLPGEAKTYDALWFVESYEPEDDIVNGYLFVRQESGFSENGSVYGKELLDNYGRNARVLKTAVSPKEINLADMIHLDDVDAILAYLVGDTTLTTSDTPADTMADAFAGGSLFD